MSRSASLPTIIASHAARRAARSSRAVRAGAAALRPLVATLLLTACQSDRMSAPAASPAPRAAQSSVQAVDLGTLGGSASIAVAVNDRGQVVGYSRIASEEWRPFLWQNGTMRELPTLGGPCPSTWFSCVALGINQSGEVVGMTANTSWQWRGTLWTRAGDAVELPALLPTGGSSARALNDRGQIVGKSMSSAGEEHAVLWEKGAVEDLGSLGGRSNAGAINERGEVAGDYTATNGQTRAFYWSRGTGLIDLAPLPGGTYAFARGINERGEIAGTSTAADGRYHAVRWTVQGGVASVADLSGVGEYSEGWKTSNAGDVVGSYATTGIAVQAALWVHGEVTILPTLGGRSLAFGISETGLVVGESYYSPWWIAVGDRATLWILH